jgi:hypothetical protein
MFLYKFEAVLEKIGVRAEMMCLRSTEGMVLP